MKTLLPLALLSFCLAGCGPATSTDSTTKTTTTETTTTSATPTAVPADAAPAATGVPATAPLTTPGTLTQANLDRVQHDMSPAEVQAIFGPPTSSSSEPIPIVGGTKTTYNYSSGGSAVTVVFKNNQEQTATGVFNP